ncbi:MAG: LysR family transcriptional regulator [Betaproteobacteria bacterium]|nr:LysR family transcriptional regulator [Betaproteobacteria bacterium]
MNLQQLRYLCAVADQKMAVSEAARVLHTSQPGVSKQLRQLEEELDIAIFVRGRHRLLGLTPTGKRVLTLARRVVAATNSIRSVSQANARQKSGDMRITTTHSLARFYLPEIIKKYSVHHRNVRILVQHAPLTQIPAAVSSGAADIGVTSQVESGSRELTFRTCRVTPRVVLTPRDHPLTRFRRLSLKAIAQFPIVITQPGSTNRQAIFRAFEAQKLKPRLVLSVDDGGVVKACVEQGLGVAVLPAYAFDSVRDTGLCALRADHLFDPSTTAIVLRRNHSLPSYADHFVEMLIPKHA